MVITIDYLVMIGNNYGDENSTDPLAICGYIPDHN